MLAYVFWHWPEPEEAGSAYERALLAFHAALRQERAQGVLDIAALRVTRAPHGLDDSVAYEDWYLVEDFEALGRLNEAAISGVRKRPHDKVATRAAGGAGGVYALRAGEPSFASARHAHWFSKPKDWSYETCFAALGDASRASDSVLWQRQMVLGPAPEFCLLSAQPVALPEPLEPRRVEVQCLVR